MKSPEYRWWYANECKRMAPSRRWQPIIGAIAVVAMAVVAIWAVVTM